MNKVKGIICGSLLAVVLVCSPALISPAGPVQAGSVAVTPDDSTGSAVGRYTTDGGKTWTVVREERGVVEKLPAGTKQADFMARHQMTPEAEAKIVHQVPEVPVIIDSVPCMAGGYSKYLHQWNELKNTSNLMELKK